MKLGILYIEISKLCLWCFKLCKNFDSFAYAENIECLINKL